ncbi:hypothetical protein AVEN_106568-1 [Araneus ventricosus]|uniref:Uncharacterized protein n=1 Tax=Araneus ventricosus TaxID=182803 RepID=A0A4Y2X2Z0_ARAVE|nr:hypothetical protein AVEN_106568-1 [Araneus ventricosus]
MGEYQREAESLNKNRTEKQKRNQETKEYQRVNEEQRAAYRPEKTKTENQRKAKEKPRNQKSIAELKEEAEALRAKNPEKQKNQNSGVTQRRAERALRTGIMKTKETKKQKRLRITKRFEALRSQNRIMEKQREKSRNAINKRIAERRLEKQKTELMKSKREPTNKKDIMSIEEQLERP